MKYGWFVLSAVAAAGALAAASQIKSEPAQGPIFALCGTKQGHDTVALPCTLTIRDGKAEWSRIP